MSQIPKVLLIDDDKGVIATTELMLNTDTQFFATSSPKEALQLIPKQDIQVVLLDIHMPGKSGAAVFGDIQKLYPDVQIIMFTAQSETKNVVEYMKRGAFSYLVKGEFKPDELIKTIQLALESRKSKLAKQVLQEQLQLVHGHTFIGSDPHTVSIFEQAQKIAKAANISVLIRGETGTGKEYLARYIHDNSDRRTEPFVAINCGAIPENLIESELFGHERGAFTDAVERKIGKFEKANGGTIFLDEIATMPFDLQVRLLRVLQERVIDRVGGTSEIDIDVRVISATNADLKKQIKKDLFREDLYYRLNGYELELQPLRKRKNDFKQVVDFFMTKHSQKLNLAPKEIDPKLLSLLSVHHWNGNMRELDTFMEVLVFFHQEEACISLKQFPKEWARRLCIRYKDIKNKPAEEREAVLKVIIEAFDENISNAAEFLEVERSTLYRLSGEKIKKPK